MCTQLFSKNGQQIRQFFCFYGFIEIFILKFSDLDNSVTVQQKNLQVLVTEFYKVKNGIAPEIMKDIFKLQNPLYN